MNIATTGTSTITRELIKAFKANDLNLIAAYSRDIKKAEAFKAEYGFKKAYDNFEDLLNDKEVDTVYIALPNALHFEYTLKALEHGKNAIVEKPFTTNMEDTMKLVETAKARHLYLFEAITAIHLPTYARMKKDLSKIGKIHLVALNFTKYSRKYDEFKNGELPNNFNPAMGGGALNDLNVYNLHVAQYLFGKPASCYYLYNDTLGADTSGVALLKYDDMIVNAMAGKDSESESYLQIIGEKGYIKATGATSITSSYEVVVGNDRTVTERDNGNPYDYEVAKMKEIFDNDDYQTHLELLDHTVAVMETLDALNQYHK